MPFLYICNKQIGQGVPEQLIYDNEKRWGLERYRL